MLRHWANYAAPDYGFYPRRVTIGVLQVADEEIGDEGGFFRVYDALLVVTPIFRDYVWHPENLHGRDRLEREWKALCHDIWMTKGVAVVGGLEVV